MEKNYKEIMTSIDTFIFDVDGVMTDGKFYYTSEGKMMKI